MCSRICVSMFSWKILKYPFGRFACLTYGCCSVISFCWILVFSARIPLGLDSARVAGKNRINILIDLLQNEPELFDRYIKHGNWFDMLLVVLMLISFALCIYFSYRYALRRTLFYPYNFIQITVPFNKINITHVLFICLGSILSITIFDILVPRPSLGLAFPHFLLRTLYDLVIMYMLLNIYLSKVSKIEWISENSTV